MEFEDNPLAGSAYESLGASFLFDQRVYKVFLTSFVFAALLGIAQSNGSEGGKMMHHSTGSEGGRYFPPEGMNTSNGPSNDLGKALQPYLSRNLCVEK